MTENQFYTSQEVADLIGYDRKTISNWALLGKMPGAVRFGRKWRFRKEEVKTAMGRESFLNDALSV